MARIIKQFSAYNKIKKRTTSKKRNIIIIVSLLLSLFLIFGTMTINYINSYQKAKNDVLELSRNSTEMDAHNIDQYFAQHREVLLTSAEALDFYLSQGNYEGTKIEELLRNISLSYSNSVYKPVLGVEFTGIYASVDGVLYHSFKDRSVLPDGYDPTQRQWYKEAMVGNGKSVFGEPYVDIYNPDQMVMTVSKLLSDGSTVIGMDITMEDLRAAVGDIGISISLNGETQDYGFGVIMTDNGLAVASSDDTYRDRDYSNPSHPMYPVYKQLMNHHITEPEGVTNYCEIELNGEEYCLFSHNLDNGWFFATLTNMKDIKTSISSFSSALLKNAVAVSIIALLYCVLISIEHMHSKKMENKLQGALDLAFVDVLTGLLNRTAYDMRVKELKESIASDDDSSFATIMFDLNDLKYINDHQGHAAGDKYICNTSALVSSVFPCDIYRIGGDEFAMFLTGKLFNQWETLYDQLKQSVAEANMRLIPSADKPSIAIGLSIHKRGEKEGIEDLLRKADAEMYTNKLAIKQMRLENSEKGYSPDVKKLLLDKQLLASEMQKGLEEEQFEVWFQPQVNHANNGTLIGAEALVRWRHPERGVVSPAVFIPIFEYNGLIYELDKYVWKHACAYVRKGLDEGMPPLPVSVNVSRYDIIQEDFIEVITSIVEEQNIPYELIHLEVTESAFADDTGEVAKVVKKLINRGFIIAIDDFGSGYSSLSLLRSIPAHIVKLDMRFFADGENQTRNECIVESIIRMVKMLGMSVLAEGAEQVEQADLLRSLGCAYIQGYLYSKPLPYDEYVTYIRTAISERNNQICFNPHTELNTKNIRAQEMFHNIIAGTNDVVIVSDSNTKQLLYANHSAEQYFGKRFDPIIPTTCMEYCNYREICMNCPANDMKQNEKCEHFISENGKHFKITINQIDWNGHDAVVSYQTDITAQMQELEFSNALIHNMPGATFAFELSKDEKPLVRYISENAKKLFAMAGIKDRLPVYDDFINVLHPEDSEHIQNALVALFMEKKAFRESFRIVFANGNIVWIESLVNPVADRDGSYLFYGVYTDITESKNAQEHIDDVLQSIPAAIAIYEVTSTDTNRIFISDHARELLMIEDDIHERRAVTELFSRVHEDDRQNVQKISQECFKEGKPFCIQFRIVSNTDIVRWVQIESKPIENENQEDGFTFYSIYTDISEQKQLEINAGLSGDRNVIESTIHFGLQEAAKQPSSELCVEYIIRFAGKVLHGERAYIFEMNPDHTNSNTYEWVEDGITPEIDNLQNVPEELSRPWYDQFEKKNIVVIEDLESIKTTEPALYERLYVQDIRSLIVAPLFNSHGKPMGFFGIDNPPKELLIRNKNLILTIAYYIEASLKRKNLDSYPA